MRQAVSNSSGSSILGPSTRSFAQTVRQVIQGEVGHAVGNDAKTGLADDIRKVADYIAEHGVNLGPAYEQDAPTLKDAVHTVVPEVDPTVLGGPNRDQWQNLVESECAAVIEYGMPSDTVADALCEYADEVEKRR